MHHLLKKINVLGDRQPDTRPGPPELGETKQIFSSLRVPKLLNDSRSPPTAEELRDIWLLNVESSLVKIENFRKLKKIPRFVKRHTTQMYLEELITELSDPPIKVVDALTIKQRIDLLNLQMDLRIRQIRDVKITTEYFRQEREQLFNKPNTPKLVYDRLIPFANEKFSTNQWYSLADLFTQYLYDMPQIKTTIKELVNSAKHPYVTPPVTDILAVYNETKDDAPPSITIAGSGRGLQSLLVATLFPSCKIVGNEIDTRLYRQSLNIISDREIFIEDPKRITLQNIDSSLVDYSDYHGRILAFLPFKGEKEKSLIEKLEDLQSKRKEANQATPHTNKNLPDSEQKKVSTFLQKTRKSISRLAKGRKLPSDFHCFNLT